MRFCSPGRPERLPAENERRFFREELGAWGGGEEDPGECFIENEPRRGERSEREGRPVAALSRPRRAEPYLLLGPPRPRRVVGGTWLTWWGSEVPHRRPGIREGVVSGGAGCRVQGEALDKGEGSAVPPAGVVPGQAYSNKSLWLPVRANLSRWASVL